VARESIKLAFVAALQHLPPRQRACSSLRSAALAATEVAELLDTSVASVNSASSAHGRRWAERGVEPTRQIWRRGSELLARYVKAFEAYDMQALTSLIQEDAKQSMPRSISGSGAATTSSRGGSAGHRMHGSRVVPTISANGSPAFGQYKPTPDGGYEPWALQVLEIEDGRIVEFTFFLDTETVFPLFACRCNSTPSVAPSRPRLSP